MNKAGHVDLQLISDCLLSNRGKHAGWIQFGMKGSFYTFDIEILRVKNYTNNDYFIIDFMYKINY